MFAVLQQRLRFFLKENSVFSAIYFVAIKKVRTFAPELYAVASELTLNKQLKAFGASPAKPVTFHRRCLRHIDKKDVLDITTKEHIDAQFPLELLPRKRKKEQNTISIKCAPSCADFNVWILRL